MSIPELTSMEGLAWRQAYEDPANDLNEADYTEQMAEPLQNRRTISIWNHCEAW